MTDIRIRAIEITELAIIAEKDKSQPAHPPTLEHWFGCKRQWCRDRYRQALGQARQEGERG